MEHKQFCQSCGMPLQEGMYGTQAGGAQNTDYCKYCYEGGKFTTECTMQEMIDFCVPHMVQGNPGMTEQQAREAMAQFFPQLKRWA